jgi:putative spermidine/putrescine transport system ATP-binding protein
VSDVRLIGLSKAYGDTVAVAATDLHVEEGEFFSLLGPSGCGKTTTLRMIAGFVEPSGGRILVGGEDVTYLPPERRNIGIVFQNYAIFPHMDVFENIAFGLRLRKVAEADIRSRVGEALEQVGLAGYDRRYQRELSGGQQQRVALARVLVTQPRILLLDEPLSALDKKLREEMKVWIKDFQRRLSITTIYVTHDQGEALTMSDRIGVMDRARIVQVGSPSAIYEEPASLFVTTFIGDSNVLDVTADSVDGRFATVDLDGQKVRARSSAPVSSGQKSKLVLRPENLLLGKAAAGIECRLNLTVIDRIYQGPLVRYRLSTGAQEIVCEMQNQSHNESFANGTKVEAAWDPARVSLVADDVN